MSDIGIKISKTLGYYWQRILHMLRGLYWSMAQPVLSRPVIIIGCSRAGTTVVYKTFSESEQLGTLQKATHDFWSDLHPLQERDWNTHALSESDASEKDLNIVSRYFFINTGQRRIVDKNNQNGLCIPYLLKLFPDACFVFVKRSPGDNINSLIEGWGKADEFATWSDEVPVEVNVESGKFKRWCFFLSNGWQDYVNSTVEEVYTCQYKSMNKEILKAKEIVPAEQWFEIKYEDILINPVECFKQAFVYFKLTFSEHLQSHCETVLSNPYNAFSEIKKDKWKEGRNRERIERVIPIVNDVANRMGY